jgi:hypothetical protein
MRLFAIAALIVATFVSTILLATLRQMPWSVPGYRSGFRGGRKKVTQATV